MNSPLPILIALAIVLLSTAAHAETWLVGPTREYKTPSAVATLVKDGDVVSIDPGEYTGDVAVWRAHKLTLRSNSNSLRPDVILRADGKAAEQKAIWVIKGDSCVVYGIDFRDCVVPDRNGAGIRVEGTNIIVSHCAFRKNQDGILAGNNLKSTIRVEHSEFEQSGAGDGLSHAIYINHVKEFIFMFNYSHGTLVGHECKSRAHANYIAYNRITNENGTGSRNLDLPNGGSSVVIGNIFHKGANAENGNFIGYGLEGMSDTVDNSLYLAHNTFVSQRGAATLVRLDTNTVSYRLVNNVIVGPIVLIVGLPRGQQVNANYVGTIESARFQDPTTYNYRPRADSPFRGLAQDPGSAQYYVAGVPHERPLTALLHYIHPCEERLRLGTNDAGAYEYENITDVTEHAAVGTLHPNPASSYVNISSIDKPVAVYTQHGVCLMHDVDQSTIDVSTFPAGLYFIVCGSQVQKLIVQH
ncbi:MAG: hypothetical protein FJ211_06830 [Ignavibacteria bacterium]|nr:hypothetical protein [Ignavibacteria bacterium]